MFLIRLQVWSSLGPFLAVNFVTAQLPKITMKVGEADVAYGKVFAVSG